MSDNMIKAIGIIGGVVMAVLLVILGFKFFNQAKSTSDSALNDVTGYATTLEESKYTTYANQTVLGSQVLSQCNEFVNTDVAVEIKLGTGKTAWINFKSEDMTGTALTKTENEEVLATLSDRTKDVYINPNGKFMCTIIRNSADTITCVKFEQQ